MILLAPQDGLPLGRSENFGVHIAGAESNVALYLADAGVPVSWLSAVGTDPFGERLVDYMSRHQVNTSLVLRDSARSTGVFFKNHSNAGTTVHYYRAGSAASTLSPDSLAGLRELCRSNNPPKVLHLSGITAALSASCLALSQAAITLGKEHGITVSFDVNFRPGLWQASTAGPVLRALANQSDVVLVGLDEAQDLWGCTTPADIQAFVPDAGELVIKDGAKGATWLGAGDISFVPTPTVDVVEVVGAGDAFAAGFLYSRLSGATVAEQLLMGHRFAARAMSSPADFRSLEDFRQTTHTERLT
ncbi:carbohydrate kinase [Arthrobacter glacialis]|nr:carbohydrate kinase [Arthrobacter glacialis]